MTQNSPSRFADRTATHDGEREKPAYGEAKEALVAYIALVEAHRTMLRKVLEVTKEFLEMPSPSRGTIGAIVNEIDHVLRITR